MNEISQAVIICGGLGTRLGPLTQDIPKSMVLVNDRPFLEHLVGYFKKQDVKRFVFCAGYLHERIISHFGDGAALGVDIEYSIEREPLGTGGAVLNAIDFLDEDFIVSYGDSYLPIEFAPLVDLYFQRYAEAVITVYDNNENIARNNVRLAKTGLVLEYNKENPDEFMNCVEAGLSVLARSSLKMAIDKKFSLEMDIFPKLINRRRLFGLLVSQRFYDIGTAEGLELGKVILDDTG